MTYYSFFVDSFSGREQRKQLNKEPSHPIICGFPCADLHVSQSLLIHAL